LILICVHLCLSVAIILPRLPRLTLMRVAIEAASLSLFERGLARYTSQLSLALARWHADDEFYLISDQPFFDARGAPANLKRGAAPRNAVERRWWLWGMARELNRIGADVVHGPTSPFPTWRAGPA